MCARDDIILAFRKLVMERAYDKITVKQICDAAGVSRKTFYVHFSNKDMIVNAIVYDAIVRPMVKMDDVIPSMIINKEVVDSLPLVMHGNVYRAIKDDFAFYSRLCAAPGTLDSPLVNALIDGIQSLNLKVMNTIGYKDEQWKVEYISYYFAAGNALIIQRWIKSGMLVPIEKLTEMYDGMSTPYWRRLAGLRES